MNASHTFTYSALALRSPLRQLLEHLGAQAAKLEPAMKDAVPAARRKSSLATPDDAQLLAMQTVNAHNGVQRDLARARLWLAEVERAWPWRRFWLTEEECAWLHRYRGVADVAKAG